MSICPTTGMACNCQPDEGIPCDGPETLRKGFHGWRDAALKAESDLAAARASLDEALGLLRESENRGMTYLLVSSWPARVSALLRKVGM